MRLDTGKNIVVNKEMITRLLKGVQADRRSMKREPVIRIACRVFDKLTFPNNGQGVLSLMTFIFLYYKLQVFHLT